jgi:hypothetical protein
MTAKPTWKQRLEHLLKEYGKVAIATYFTIFGLVLAGFVVALQMGVQVEGAAKEGGLLVAAYVATKLTQPLRIGATLVLTPLVARLVRRGRPPPPDVTGT